MSFDMSLENESFYSKLIKTNFKECQQSICRKLELKISVDSHFGISRKEVIIGLSLENDPFFLFITTITELIFNKIKSSENLLIDFMNFPKKLIDLLETCFEEQNKDKPRFILSLKEINKELVLLEVIEINEFKHLIHFSLKIAAANQELIKSSISQTYRNLKLENEKLQNRLHSIELQLSENVLLKAKELEIIENECELKLKNTEIKFKKEIDVHKHLINELMAKESESKSLIEKLRTQLETSEENVRQQQKLRTENELQTITELNNKIVSLEQQLCETQDFYNIEKREAIRAQTQLQEKDKILEQSNQNNQLLTQDLSKANQIIRKLQTEVQSTHQKLSLLNKVATKQEQAVGVKQSTVHKLQSDLLLCTEELKIKDKEYENLRKDFESLKNKCDESQVQLNTNQNVIAFLNKQISELQLKHGIKSSAQTTQSSHSTLPEVNLVEKQTSKTDPKIIAQRNALFSATNTKNSLFKR